MRRERKIYYSNKPQRKIYVDYSPKINAKNKQPHLYYKNEKQQVSAYMHRRNPDFSVNCPESSPKVKPKQILKTNQQHRNILTEQQIRHSALYRMLEQQIQQLARQQNQQLAQLRKAKETKSNQLTTINKQQYSVKLQIWELRNQVSQLKDSIQQEKRQTQRLNEELGIGQEAQDQPNQANLQANQDTSSLQASQT